MTMHLAQGLTTTKTSQTKRKKLTKAELFQLKEDHSAYNKRMRQSHCHQLRTTFEEYIDYVHGRRKNPTKFTEYQAPKQYRRETPHIPSLGSGVGNGFVRTPQIYTGDLICGVATMHKSNAVPVMRGTKQAEEIAKMRR